MKKILFVCTLMFFTLSICAEEPIEQKKFNPEQFARDQEAFIVKEAKLTQHEAAAFFPLFREMQQKQRALFKKQRQCTKNLPQDDKAAAQLISDMDEMDLQMKKIQIHYHSKFLKVLSATKVYLCIRAEEKFKHNVMDRLSQISRERGRKEQK